MGQQPAQKPSLTSEDLNEALDAWKALFDPPHVHEEVGEREEEGEEEDEIVPLPENLSEQALWDQPV